MSTTQTTTTAALSGIGNLIKLLPTGTVFLFQYLNPLLTNNGHCHPINKILTGVLVALCAFSCCFSSFTDCYVDEDGVTHCGIVTCTGLWTPSSSSSTQDLSSYKLRFGDFVHAFCSLLVFGVVVLLDSNSVKCYYPSFESTQKALLMSLPPVVGTVTASIFVYFPNTRHTVGQLPPSTSSQPSTSVQS